MVNMYGHDYAINFDSNNYIIVKTNFKLGSLEFVMKWCSDLIKKALKLMLLIVFILHHSSLINENRFYYFNEVPFFFILFTGFYIIAGFSVDTITLLSLLLNFLITIIFISFPF